MTTDVESELKSLFDSGERAAAVETSIRKYGAEVLGFLVARLGDRDVASDVFAETCEDLWKSSESFAWRCSMRTWMYKLARSAAARYLRSPANRMSRRQAMSRMSDVVADVRSVTMKHLQTEVKDKFAAIRDELPPDDRTILILRINRQLSWDEVARVLNEDELDSDAIKRESARLRQRFQSIKGELKKRATELGLLD